MVEKPDAGRIVDQQEVPIGPDDTAVQVFHKVTGAAQSAAEAPATGWSARRRHKLATVNGVGYVDD